jgi:hypothetical protein
VWKTKAEPTSDTLVSPRAKAGASA